MAFQFYLSTDNPTGLTGSVGGAINTNSPVTGYLGELFAHVSAPPSGVDTSGAFQYRKVYVRNEYAVNSTNTKVWLDAVEHSGQISIALESESNQSTTFPTGEPTGVTSWSYGADYNAGVLLGTLSGNGGSSGLWIRQELSGINVADPYASFRLYVGGVVEV